MGVTARALRADEAAAVKAVRLRALREDPDAFGSTLEREEALPEQWWRDWARRAEDGTQQCTFVVDGVQAGALGGLALVRPVGDGRGRAEVLAMWVAPELRGQGAAAALVEAAAGWAGAHGCRELELQLVADNERARRAYERAGFTVTGRTTWSDGTRELDELVMRRPLG